MKLQKFFKKIYAFLLKNIWKVQDHIFFLIIMKKSILLLIGPSSTIQDYFLLLFTWHKLLNIAYLISSHSSYVISNMLLIYRELKIKMKCTILWSPSYKYSDKWQLNSLFCYSINNLVRSLVFLNFLLNLQLSKFVIHLISSMLSYLTNSLNN